MTMKDLFLFANWISNLSILSQKFLSQNTLCMNYILKVQ